MGTLLVAISGAIGSLWFSGEEGTKPPDGQEQQQPAERPFIVVYTE